MRQGNADTCRTRLSTHLATTLLQATPPPDTPSRSQDAKRPNHERASGADGARANRACSLSPRSIRARGRSTRCSAWRTDPATPTRTGKDRRNHDCVINGWEHGSRPRRACERGISHLDTVDGDHHQDADNVLGQPARTNKVIKSSIKWLSVDLRLLTPSARGARS